MMALVQTWIQKLCRAGVQRSLNKCSSTNASTQDLASFSQIGSVATSTSEVSVMEETFKKDRNMQKVNLGINAYRTSKGEPYKLSVLRKAEIAIACNDFLDHEYLPPAGNPEFTAAAKELVLGQYSPAIVMNRAISIQTLSGTGALKLAADFLHQCLNAHACIVSEPGSEYYMDIFKAAGFTKCIYYRYCDAGKRHICLHNFVADLLAAPQGAVVVFQTCAHNPTGIDPSEEEWKLIAQVVKCNKLIPLFHLAYQGLASGDPDRDAWPVRCFVNLGLNVLCAQSFDTNFGLYNERVGNLTMALNTASAVQPVLNQLEALMSRSYHSPVAYGSRVVAKILSDRTLRGEWLNNLKEMTKHMLNSRSALAQKLNDIKAPGNWDYLLEQMGMFSCLNLHDYQVSQLRMDKHIYLPKNGRLNICALNSSNLDYVANAIKDILTAGKVDDICLSGQAQALYSSNLLYGPASA